MKLRDALLMELLRGQGHTLDLERRVIETFKTKVRFIFRIYECLRTLEDDQLVESWDGEALPERGNRPRRYYKLTNTGLLAAAAAAKASEAELKKLNEEQP